MISVPDGNVAVLRVERVEDGFDSYSAKPSVL
jgi:hypothetical protein